MLLRTIQVCAILSITMLTGCQSIKLTEKHFLLPDKPITQNLLDENKLGQTIKRVSVTADNATLGGIIVLQPNAKFTTLYFGGNATRIQQQGEPIVKHLTGFNNNLVVFDHRGYGLSNGKPSIDNLKTDAQLIFDFVQAQPELSDLPIIVHGLSLGSMIAADLANNRAVDGLVLEGSATTVNDWLDASIPLFVKPFIDIQLDSKLTKIDNIKLVEQYNNPLLIVIGEDDNQTPVNLSEKLYVASKSEDKKLIIIPEKRHGNATDSEMFKAAFTDFYKRIIHKGKI